MKLTKLRKKEWYAIKNKILHSLKKVELHVLLDNGEIKGALPVVEGYREVIENILESFDSRSREKVLQYFSKRDISGLITDESYPHLGDEEYKDLKGRIPRQHASKTGLVPDGTLAELLPLSKLEVIAENILVFKLSQYVPLTA